MNPSTLQTGCQIFFAIGIIVTAVAGLGSFHYGKKATNVKEGKLTCQIKELVTGKNELISQNKQLLIKIEEKDEKIKELDKKAKTAARGIVSIYDFNGTRRDTTPGSIKASVGPEVAVFQKMNALHDARDWPVLIELCTNQINQTPDWLTPYLFRGIARANTGKKEEARSDLRYVVDNAGADPKYEQAKELLKKLEESP